MEARVLAITGGIGSGKSTLCRILAERGVPVYDSDSRTRAMYERDAQLVQTLGERLGVPELLSGKMDRKALAARIFSDPAALQTLEGIVHPRVLEDFLRWKQALPNGPWTGPGAVPFVVLESAIVLERPLFAAQIDRTLWIEAPEALRLERAAKRDGADVEALKARAATQLALSARADAVLVNDGTPEQLGQKALELIENLF